MRMDFGTRLSAEQVDELLKQPGCIANPHLSFEHSDRYYQLPDGRILMVMEDDNLKEGIVYKSKDALETLWRQLEAWAEAERQKPAGQWLKEEIPQQKEFVAQVPALINQLAEKLKLRRHELDFCDESMKKVHSAACTLYDPEPRTGPDLMPNLVAYIGEAIRQKVGGKWEMVRYEDTDALDPCIIGPNGEAISVRAEISKDFYEAEYGAGAFSINHLVRRATAPPPPPDPNAVSPEQAKQLISQPGCKEVFDLFDGGMGDRFYELPDGRVLTVRRKGKGYLSPSRQYLEQMRDYMVEQMREKMNQPPAKGPVNSRKETK